MKALKSKSLPAAIPCTAVPVNNSLSGKYPPPKFCLGQVVGFDWAKNFPGEGRYFDCGRVVGLVLFHPEFDHYHQRKLGVWTYAVAWVGKRGCPSSSFTGPSQEFAHESELQPMGGGR